MTKIKLAMRDRNDRDVFREKDGIIVQGIGIIEILSGGKMVKFAVDSETGLIIPSLSEKDIEKMIEEHLAQ